MNLMTHISGMEKRVNTVLCTPKLQIRLFVFFNPNLLILSLFLQENICCGYICCGYSLEAPRRGTSNEYPQHMVFFSAEIGKHLPNIPSYLELNGTGTG